MYVVSRTDSLLWGSHCGTGDDTLGLQDGGSALFPCYVDLYEDP